MSNHIFLGCQAFLRTLCTAGGPISRSRLSLLPFKTIIGNLLKYCMLYGLKILSLRLFPPTILCLFHSLYPLLFPHHFLSHPPSSPDSAMDSGKLAHHVPAAGSWYLSHERQGAVIMFLFFSFSTSRPLICDDYFE